MKNYKIQKHGLNILILKAMEANLENPADNTAESSEEHAIGSDAYEPAVKKIRLKRSYIAEEGGECSMTQTTTLLKLEKRLSIVLCCTVCLDLPISTIFQVIFLNISK